MLDVINSVISYLGNKDNNMADEEVSVNNSQNISVKPAKCHLSIVDLQGVPINSIENSAVFCGIQKPTLPRQSTVIINRDLKSAFC